MLESAANPVGMEALQAYQKRLDSVLKKLAGKKGMSVTSFEVREFLVWFRLIL